VLQGGDKVVTFQIVRDRAKNKHLTWQNPKSFEVCVKRFKITELLA